jgi:hypothetical protein
MMHTRRRRRHYSAFFCNTAHAHEMNKTKDWVVIYYDGHGGERQCTVITSQRGPLASKRIVRGREEECAAYYKKIESGYYRAGMIETTDSPFRSASGIN